MWVQNQGPVVPERSDYSLISSAYLQFSYILSNHILSNPNPNPNPNILLLYRTNHNFLGKYLKDSYISFEKFIKRNRKTNFSLCGDICIKAILNHCSVYLDTSLCICRNKNFFVCDDHFSHTFTYFFIFLSHHFTSGYSFLKYFLEFNFLN